MSNEAPSHFQKITHTHKKWTHDVYITGTGPIVILLHEIPNPTPEAFALADRLSEAGFMVHVPIFFGKVNAPFSTGRAVSELCLGCIRKEFAVFATQQSSPVVEWIRSLCLKRMEDTQQDKIGMIGMCMTGNFALGLCAEKWMQAPVLCQPSLPYPLSKKYKSALHISKETLHQAKEREDLEIVGLRFSHDWMCPKERFERLSDEFGERFNAIEIDSSVNNMFNIRTTAHSVLTMDFVDEEGHPTKEAWDTVRKFLNRKLKSD